MGEMGETGETAEIGETADGRAATAGVQEDVLVDLQLKHTQ